MGERRTTPTWIVATLRSPAAWWLARVALTLPYWWSGIEKLLHPQAALAEISSLGLPSPEISYAMLLLTQLVGSLLVICNRWTWLGAGALGVFTAIVTVLAHPFWNLQGAERFAAMSTFLEHIALIAGFVYAAMLAVSRLNSESP